MSNDGRIERVRLKFERDFTQIPNEWLRDRRLSRDARGLLAELMSHDSGYIVTVKQLVAHGLEGRAAVDRMIRELKALDYLEHELIRGKHGRIEGTVWRLTDPAEVASRRRSQPQLDLPGAGKPGTRSNRHPDNQHLKEAHTEEHSYSPTQGEESTRAQREEDALTGASSSPPLRGGCIGGQQHTAPSEAARASLGPNCLRCAEPIPELLEAGSVAS